LFFILFFLRDPTFFSLFDIDIFSFHFFAGSFRQFGKL